MIPGNKTELHALEPEHLKNANRWVNDPDVRQWLTLHRPVPLRATRKWYDAMLESNSDHVFAVCTKRGIHIGNIGLHQIDWKNRNAQLGILIGEARYRSRGYGEDAVRALLRFAFHELNLHRVNLYHYAHNSRARVCYEKCGFRNEGMHRDALFLNGRYYDVAVMGILDREFRALEYAKNA